MRLWFQQLSSDMKGAQEAATGCLEPKSPANHRVVSQQGVSIGYIKINRY